MSKGAVIAATVVGAVVILGGGAYALAASSRRTASAMRPDLAPPPPPPSLAGDVAVIGTALLHEGGKALSELANSQIGETLTGGEGIVSYGTKSVATGGLYTVYAAGKGVLSNLFGSSKVCRGSNGKDVFPNDMEHCRQRGITDCEGCSRLFNMVTRKWPWQV